ncbi:PREDICTED: mucin-5AC-like [Erythranthe guttata]|uniref:mucin-5AC-like n=1 Tax=Erythranthe guttata TaxID=4155 RepID=UPI00064DA2A1|nr:PREDICTED: mucin-5AC-like [Erythranthe guttata]|eukprot:XP_012836245.1 PREDICTED: mucin-5AC-like [Erythranthe guttata]
MAPEDMTPTSSGITSAAGKQDRPKRKTPTPTSSAAANSEKGKKKKESKPYKKKAKRVKKLLEKAIPGVYVVFNPETPRKGFFEIRNEGGEALFTLMDMNRVLNALDADILVSDIVDYIKRFGCINCQQHPISPTLRKHSSRQTLKANTADHRSPNTTDHHSPQHRRPPQPATLPTTTSPNTTDHHSPPTSPTTEAPNTADHHNPPTPPTTTAPTLPTTAAPNTADHRRPPQPLAVASTTTTPCRKIKRREGEGEEEARGCSAISVWTSTAVPA